MTRELAINLSLIINTGITLKMADIIDVNLIIILIHSTFSQKSGSKIYLVTWCLMCFERYHGQSMWLCAKCYAQKVSRT